MRKKINIPFKHSHNIFQMILNNSIIYVLFIIPSFRLAQKHTGCSLKSLTFSFVLDTFSKGYDSHIDFRNKSPIKKGVSMQASVNARSNCIEALLRFEGSWCIHLQIIIRVVFIYDKQYTQIWVFSFTPRCIYHIDLSLFSNKLICDVANGV